MKILLLYSFLRSTVCAFAQQEYTFSNCTLVQGLSSGTIRLPYKDTTRYVWLTGEEGVSRFDGYT
ncbi:MAG: hypothetical protein IPN60_20750 [Saprospiraceae bacterium]|nr:hypothetical protein [Candidatus Opimibacter skivensis]